MDKCNYITKIMFCVHRSVYMWLILVIHYVLECYNNLPQLSNSLWLLSTNSSKAIYVHIGRIIIWKTVRYFLSVPMHIVPGDSEWDRLSVPHGVSRPSHLQDISRHQYTGNIYPDMSGTCRICIHVSSMSVPNLGGVRPKANHRAPPPPNLKPKARKCSDI